MLLNSRCFSITFCCHILIQYNGITELQQNYNPRQHFMSLVQELPKHAIQILFFVEQNGKKVNLYFQEETHPF